MDSTSSSPDQPPRIPDHEMLRCIGRGSYGEVWLARSRMGAYRAVKIVERKSFKDEKPFERELSGIRKFEPISRSHEGFIDILHVGMDEARGYFYYVMELGDDQANGQSIDVERYSPRTLAKEISVRGHLTWKESLELGLALSQALAELHKRGLVHRDVKPSNIIFVNGIPKLADIGLVAEIDQARSFVGTEGYIPPDGPGTPQADVYGLGKVLYEACTGLDRLNFPELPASWEKFPEREWFLELNEVILHACRNEPARRYLSAWEMYAELVILANGKSVKRLRTLERRLSLFKRGAIAVSLALLVLGPLGYQVYRERLLAAEARQRQVGANLAYGNRALESGDLIGALPYYAEAFRLDQAEPKAELQHRLRAGSVLSQCPKLVQIWFGNKRTDCAVLSPDGKLVLAVEYNGQARIFNVSNAQPVTPPFGQSFGLRQGAFSPDGRLVVTAAEDKTACIWDASDGHLVRSFPHPDRVQKAVFSPDGRSILTACNDNNARVWNAKTGETQLLLPGHTNAVLSARYSRDGRRIVTASRDTTVRIWDSAGGQPIGRPLRHRRWVYDSAFSPDCSQVITLCDDRLARVWDLASGSILQAEMLHHDVISGAEFSPDGRLILTACLDGTARLWDAQTHLPLLINPVLPHSDRVIHASFAADGHRFVTSCADGTVRVWDLAGSLPTPRPMHALFSEDGTGFLTLSNNEIQVSGTVSQLPVAASIRPASPVAKAALSPDGRFVLSQSTNSSNPGQSSLQLYSVATLQPIGPALLLTNAPHTMLVSSNGSVLLTCDSFAVQVWNVNDGKLLSFRALNGALKGASLNLAGTLAATWSGNALSVFSTASGQDVFTPINHPFAVTHAEFSPDGRQLVSCFAEPGYEKCCAQVWDVHSGRLLVPRLQHQDGVVWASFSPDGRCIATAAEDSSAAVWDSLSGKPLAAGLQHDMPIWTAILNSNATWLATASSDRTARIWNAQTGYPLTPPLRHLQPLRTARFLASDTHIFTLDKNGDAFVWKLPIETKPAEDVLGLARLLCGGKINPALGLRTAPAETLEQLWHRLKAKYPECFETSTEDAAAWYEFQAQESELDENWAGAAFHWQRLVEIRPDDPAARQHLAECLREHKRVD